ncbi:hypothetical protein ACSBR2_041658 [Camellia fascicularis]
MCHAPAGLRIRRLVLANRDIHEGRSESGGLISPKVSCTSEALNPETYIGQLCHAPAGLQIRRLVLANRDIYEGRSESGGLIGRKVSCTSGAPNPETCVGQS